VKHTRGARIRDFGCGELHTIGSAGLASVHHYVRTASHPHRVVEHVYPSHSIVFTDIGEWCYHGTDKPSTISPNVVVTGIGQHHYSCAHPDGMPNECFVVALNDDALDGEGAALFPVPMLRLSPEIHAHRRAIVRALDAAEDDERIESLAFSLYDIASRESSRPTRVPAADVRMAYAKKVIRDRASEPTKIADIARELDLSRFTFTRRFLTAAGVTPHQFMSQIRIERAKEQLRRTKWSIERIGAANGFGSIAHFSHAFRTIVGCTPTAYRAMASSSTFSNAND
jgi:AraC-like DNA-binding protein